MKNDLEGKMIYSVIFILILVIYILITGMINDLIGYNFPISMSETASNFLGALSGALITGVLALYISKREAQRIEQAEIDQGKKVLRILNQYSKKLFQSIGEIFDMEDKYFEIKDPMDDIPIIEIGPDQYNYEYYPEDQIKDYEELTTPLLSQRKLAVREFINTYRKLREIDTNKMNLDQLDKYLSIMSDLESVVLPYVYEIEEMNYCRKDIRNKDKIKDIVFELFKLTNN